MDATEDAKTAVENAETDATVAKNIITTTDADAVTATKRHITLTHTLQITHPVAASMSGSPYPPRL